MHIMDHNYTDWREIVYSWQARKAERRLHRARLLEERRDWQRMLEADLRAGGGWD